MEFAIDSFEHLCKRKNGGLNAKISTQYLRSLIWLFINVRHLASFYLFLFFFDKILRIKQWTSVGFELISSK